MTTRFFDVTPGYCPTCDKRVFFSYTVGLSGICHICDTFIPNIFGITEILHECPEIILAGEEMVCGTKNK